MFIVRGASYAPKESYDLQIVSNCNANIITNKRKAEERRLIFSNFQAACLQVKTLQPFSRHTCRRITHDHHLECWNKKDNFAKKWAKQANGVHSIGTEIQARDISISHRSAEHNPDAQERRARKAHCPFLFVLRTSRCRKNNLFSHICKDHQLLESIWGHRAMQRMRIMQGVQREQVIQHTWAWRRIK